LNRLELRVPPPAVAAVAALLMWLAAQAVPALDFPLAGREWISFVIAAAGLMILAAALMEFRRAKTTINPIHPDAASALVVGGIYRLTRNPMYLGLLTILLAWAIWLANAAAFAVLPLFVAYLNRFQIGPEERALEACFGEAFGTYRRAVRRWL
jgi:protein-S-isoprenylcysteine O-methyltransferase Ste14